MTDRDPAIVVIGATGFTGGLVARELARELTRGHTPPDAAPVVLAARDPDRLAAVAEEVDANTTQTVDVTDPASLDALIRPGDAVINTAGPFTELGEPVIRACIRAGAHYLDTTGEQPFMRRIRDRYHDRAVDAGVTVVNAMAFEYALGDCAIAVAAQGRQPLRSVDVFYAWGGTASSVGTRRTVLRMLGRKGCVRRRGELRKLPPGAHHRTVVLASGRTLHAVTFGAGEVLTAPRHVEVEDVRGWAVIGSTAARLAPLAAPALPIVMPLIRPLLEPLVTRKPDPTPAQRAADAFTIRVEMEPRDGPSVAIEVQGADAYGITATAAVLGARRTMEPDAPRGVLAPAQFMDPRSFLGALAPRVELVGEPTT